MRVSVYFSPNVTIFLLDLSRIVLNADKLW